MWTMFVGPQSISCPAMFLTYFTVVSRWLHMGGLYVLQDISLDFGQSSTKLTLPLAVSAFLHFRSDEVVEFWEKLCYWSLVIFGDVRFKGISSGAKFLAERADISWGRQVPRLNMVSARRLVLGGVSTIATAKQPVLGLVNLGFYCFRKSWK